jgi:tetratricopeptide (TPR) repeat protein
MMIAFVALAAETVLIAPLFMRGDSAKPAAAPPAPTDPAAAACARVVSVLEGQLAKIGENGEASDYLERAKILNRLSLDACSEEARRNYFIRAVSELQVADSLRLLSAPMTDISQKVGFYWKERAEFFRMHQMADREIEIYDKYLSVPGRGRDVYSLLKKAEALARTGRVADSIMIYADIADICRTANNSNCYVAGAQFADMLEENADNSEILGELKRRWPKDSDFKDLFRFNGEASQKIRRLMK